MKKITSLLFISASIIVASCNSNTTTQMPDSGFKQRSDSATMPTNLDEKPTGAVGIDSVKNGQVNTNGASITDTARKADSTK